MSLPTPNETNETHETHETPEQRLRAARQYLAEHPEIRAHNARVGISDDVWVAAEASGARALSTQRYFTHNEEDDTTSFHAGNPIGGKGRLT